MPGGEEKTKNNIAGRVGSGLLFFLNWKDATCAPSVYASCSVQGRHKGAIREAANTRSPRAALTAGCSLETT